MIFLLRPVGGEKSWKRQSPHRGRPQAAASPSARLPAWHGLDQRELPHSSRSCSWSWSWSRVAVAVAVDVAVAVAVDVAVAVAVDVVVACRSSAAKKRVVL